MSAGDGSANQCGGTRRGDDLRFIPIRGRVNGSDMDRYAQALSEHGDAARASRDIGATLGRGRALLARIKRGLGWQAAECAASPNGGEDASPGRGPA